MASQNLPNVLEINQDMFAKIVETSINVTHDNVLVFAQSGAGKTEIAIEKILECNCSYLYISLPVLERTDFQGLPVIDRQSFNVKYATPDFIPFQDTVIYNKINKLKSIVDLPEMSLIKNSIQSKIYELSKSLSLNKIYEAKSLLESEFSEQEFKSFSDVLKLADELASKSPLVILFDEVDKAPPEVNQILLEILHLKTINGKSLNLRCCILTANLPDENAYSNNLSHAITKRCSTFKMNIEWEPFYNWASRNNFDRDILDFLVKEKHEGRNSLYSVTDCATEYALQSPRTWTLASRAKKAIEKMNIIQDEKDELIKTKIAGFVGEKSAVEYTVFINHLKRFEHDIKSIIEHGCLSENKTINKIDTSDLFIIGTSVMGTAFAKLKQDPKNIDSWKNTVINVFSWVTKLQADDMLAIFRLTFGEDKKVFQDAPIYKVTEVNEFVNSILKKKNEIDHQFTEEIAFSWIENKQAFIFAKFDNRTSTEVSVQESEQFNVKVRGNIQLKTLKHKDGVWLLKSSSSKTDAIRELKELGFKENNSLTLKVEIEDSEEAA